MTATTASGRKSSRRQVSIHDPSRWVFNRMADAYDARPPYPATLVDRIAVLTRQVGTRIADLGAGIGHLALPLAARGLEVTAVEPARAMLERLESNAIHGGLPLRCLHAAAESLPLVEASVDAVLIADALHFIDTELAGREVRRVLVPGGNLLVLSCAWADTPYMQEVARIMHEDAQRKPRQMQLRRAQLGGVARVRLTDEQVFHDAKPVTHDELERILASVSFIGPAMNAERTANFRARIHGLAERHQPVWARKFTLRWGRSQPAQPLGLERDSSL